MIGRHVTLHILRHRSTIAQFIKFGTVGGAGFFLDNILIYAGMHGLGLSPIAAGLFSFPFVVVFTWLGNRLYTFRDSKPMPMHVQLARFVAVCAIGLIFNRGTYSLLVGEVPLVMVYTLLGVPVIAVIAGTAAGMFFNFFASKKLVFR
jgi:putative flippase GtrA